MMIINDLRGIIRWFWVAHAKNVFQFQRTAILAVAFHPFPFSTLMMKIPFPVIVGSIVVVPTKSWFAVSLPFSSYTIALKCCVPEALHTVSITLQPIVVVMRRLLVSSVATVLFIPVVPVSFSYAPRSGAVPL